MSSQLQINLENILNEKITKILPENLKKGVTLLGVTGTMESGGTSSGVKIFETVEAMKADTTAKSGDKAIVCKNYLENMTRDSIVSLISFPDTVVLPEAFTFEAYGTISNVNSGDKFYASFPLSSTQFIFTGSTNNNQKNIRVVYTSQDGITYTRTEFTIDGENTTNPISILPSKLDSGDPMMGDQWNDMMGYFIQVVKNDFEGMYDCMDSMDGVLTFNRFIPKSGYTYPDTEAVSYISNTDILDILIPYLDEQGYTIYSLTLIKKSDNIFTAYCSVTSNDPKALAVTRFLYYNNKVYVRPGYNSSPSYKIEINTSTKTCELSSVTATDYVTIKNTNLTYFEEVTDYSYALYNDTSFSVFYPNNSTSGYTTQSVAAKTLFKPKWFKSDTQLTAIATNVYDSIFYGKNGVETGTLGTNISTTFTDANAEIYNKIQLVYDNIEPTVFTDDSHNVDFNTIIIPCKSNGTPLLNTSGMTNMKFLFANCAKLTFVSLLDTSNVTNMASMFGWCYKLVSIPEFNTSKVTDMNCMFLGCYELTFMPMLDTSKVTDMTSMFRSCRKLVSMPLLDMTNVTKSTQMFWGCTSLSDESLNNILTMCANATNMTSAKTLKNIGLTSEQATKCTTLSNYSAFTAAGWTTGY